MAAAAHGLPSMARLPVCAFIGRDVCPATLRGVRAMTTPLSLLRANLRASIAAKCRLLDNGQQLAAFEAAAQLAASVYRSGGRLYIAGNGGSAADAQHLAAEFVVKLCQPRAPLAAEALATDVATLTAIANDFSFEEVFARQLECKASAHDAFIALSTSGESPNIVRALEHCRMAGVPSILLGGRGGGRAGRLANISVIVPGENSCQIQELHVVLYHTLVAYVESALFGDEPVSAAAAHLSDSTGIS
jgi:D-sedoheptulose 7-phosphate isomerase